MDERGKDLVAEAAAADAAAEEFVFRFSRPPLFSASSSLCPSRPPLFAARRSCRYS